MSNPELALPSRNQGAIMLHVAPWWPRCALIVLMGVVYSGVLPFLIYLSPYVLYGLYVVLIAHILLCLLADIRVMNNVKTLLPYFAWITYYCLFGTIVSPYKSVILPDLNRLLVQTTLILASFAICISGKSDLRK